PAAAQIDLHSPVGTAGDHLRLGLLAQHVKGFTERLGPDEGLLAHGGGGSRYLRWRTVQPLLHRVLGLGAAQSVGGIPDRPVTGAPAQVAAQGVQVETVGSASGVPGAAAASGALGGL